MRSLHRVIAWLTFALLCHTPAMASAEPGKASPHGGYVESCKLCHSADGWKPVVLDKEFDHKKYGFPLRDAHTLVTCRSCHESLDFSVAEAACVECHQDVHHGEFGTDCGLCHTTRNFVERALTMRRHRMSRFPLVGAHTALDCGSCHPPAPTGQMAFVNTPAECEFCHLDRYQATTNPDHSASGFPLDCSRCHSSFGWESARFNHAATGFALGSAHTGLNCDDCHLNNQFIGTSPDCVSCHLDDFNQTTNPDHTATGFSTDCALCHRATTWNRVNYNHNAAFFPIYSGAHQGKWTLCSECHTNPTVFSDFDCLNCHPHSDKSKTDEKHKNKPNYVYDSQACFNCHPRGKE
jgi:hypothetical protein